MMRNIHLGVKLPFETEEDREDSEDILMRLLGIMSRLNLQYLRRHPKTPALYDSGVRYTPPDQLDRPKLAKDKVQQLFSLLQEMGLEAQTGLTIYRIVCGIEEFLDIPSLYRRGKGDCNELVPVRVAELWRAGVAASPYLVKQRNGRGGWTYHALVQWLDGSSEDPSLILGMGGADRAADRLEEIRKNTERWTNYMQAAQQLIAAEGAKPDVLGWKIDQMAILPQGGVFRA